MKKVLGSILLIVYSIIAISVTVLLLSFNEYNCSEIGGYTVFILNNDSLEPEYKQGSILLIKETSDKNVQKGDELFIYKVMSSQEYELVNRTLLDKSQQGRHITYMVDNEESYASEYFVGKASDTIVIEGWGYVLGLLESKWGYLFCVVIVSLLLFLQEVFELTMEIKYNREKKARANAAKAEENRTETHRTVARTATRTVTRTNAESQESAPKTASTVRKTSATKTASTASKTGTATRTRKTATVGSSKTSTTTGTRKTTRPASAATKTVKAEKEKKETSVEEE